MMDQETAPKANDLKQHEVQEVLGFLKRYGKLIGAGLLAAAITVLASKGLAHQKATKLAKAEQLLINAQSPQQLEEIVTKYSSTPTAPVALLNLAKNYFNNGDYALARTQYERFLKKYGKHEMRTTADLGLAYCTEADGDFNGAATQFAAFVQKNKESYLQPQAVLSIARCMEQAGRIDEARIVLEDFLAENAGTQWASLADNALKTLNDSALKK